MRPLAPFPRSLQVLIACTCVVILIAALRAASTVLVPFVLALFVAVASLPALDWLRRIGVPVAASVLLVILMDSALLGLLAWIVAASTAEVSTALPAYLERFRELEQSLLSALHGLGFELAALPYEQLVRPERMVDLISTLLVGLTEVVSAGFIVLLFLVFILAEAAGFPGKLRAAFGGRAGDLSRLAPIVGEVQGYLALKTAVSAATGLLVGISAALLGVDFALLWGLLAFLLNYVPNIGSIIAAIPAVSLALLQLGPGTAGALAAAYLAINLVLGNLVEPALMGRRLGLSTLVVLVSLVFWGWVWGIAGMLLSLPLTMAVKIALEGTTGLRWVAVLLGPANPPAPPSSISGSVAVSSPNLASADPPAAAPLEPRPGG